MHATTRLPQQLIHHTGITRIRTLAVVRTWRQECVELEMARLLLNALFWRPSAAPSLLFQTQTKGASLVTCLLMDRQNNMRLSWDLQREANFNRDSLGCWRTASTDTSAPDPVVMQPA